MTIDRDHRDGPITFCCDTCGETDETHCTDFHGALAKAKRHGWLVSKRYNAWFHYCSPECADAPSD